MFQESVDYSLTARENITISDIDKNDENLLYNVIKTSKVDQIIEGWENGLETPLTKRFCPDGKELSGGGWKRFALARAYYRNSPIILLDEPSASLDPVAEHEIFNDFVDLARDKGAILITHRLSNLAVAERILLLDNGQIIEEGSHSELLKSGGKYAELFSVQASKYI